MKIDYSICLFVDLYSHPLLNNCMRKSTLARLPILFCFLISSIVVSAQWNGGTTINNPICTTPDDQYYTTITSDGAGGAIIAWSDNRSGNYDVYAQSSVCSQRHYSSKRLYRPAVTAC